MWLLIVATVLTSNQVYYRHYEFKTQAQCLAALQTTYFVIPVKNAAEISVKCEAKS